MTPDIKINKTDGNLSVASDTDRILAIIAPASSGTLNVATSQTNKNDITDGFTDGLLVEAGVYCVARGIPVVLIRTNPTTAGAYGTIDDAGITGTAEVAATPSTNPHGSYDMRVEILVGGALGTTGITYRVSFDAGVNWSPETGLGTSLVLAAGSGVSFTFADSADTLVAGDKFSVATTGPKASTTDLATSLTALSDYSGEWLRVLVIGCDADATIIAQLENFAKSFHDEGKYPEVITNTRRRGDAESRPTYQAAMAVIRDAVQTTETSVCVDECEVVSDVDGKRLRMPQAISFAARTMLIDDSQDAAAKADGALPGVFLTTAAGVRRYHDERRFPGLDALGFTTLRTFGGRPVSPGAYVNNPRLLSGPGSDYRYFQHSAIVNRIIETSFQLLGPRLSQSVLCDPTTGKIREDIAKGIDDSITADLRTRFSDPGRVSAVFFKLWRTDDVLSTDTVHFDSGAVPLAYLKHFIGKTGLARKLPAN